MAKFAKIFDIDTDQLLVVLDSNNEGYPCVKFTTMLSSQLIVSKIRTFRADVWQPDEKEFARMLIDAREFFHSVDLEAATLVHKELEVSNG